jgi:spore coat polysaccharide biosynthesis protein SpsF
MRIGAIIQARVGSTRLPAKVLKELPYGSGITALEQVIRRTKKAKSLDKVIVATTAKKEDDAIADIVVKEKVLIFRGSNRQAVGSVCQKCRRFAKRIVFNG